MTADPIKFLLVDDVEENLVALEALLKREGLELLKARSGSEALELLLVNDVALAILDVQMPVMTGFELAELMRGAERTRHIPIIFITAGASDPQHVFQGYEAGAVDFLYKPVDARILESKANVFFELCRQKQELADALRLNEMFVGILGHDLRNPLGTILTGARLLEHQLHDEASLQTVRRLASAGHRMTEMIEQLLDLTRARLAGGLGFLRARRRLDVGNLVQRTVEELRGAHPDKDLAVEVVGDATTSGDADRLLQLFSNLIGNALQHGTGSSLSVSVEGGDREISVRVRNEGIISPHALPTIFEPFRRTASLSATSRGLGLGLFISQQIAIAHGGGIVVQSSEATGTIFTARIPRRSAASPRSFADGPKTVLIVEDEEHIRESLREAFEEEGYRVATAANGQEALDRLMRGASPPDVVVLDLVLPVIDGWRVHEAMQADAALAKIPVVVSTSNPASAPLGVTVVAKPLKLDRLLDAVGALWREKPVHEGVERTP